MSDYDPQEYDAFMREWENKNGYKPFCYDGILNDDLWKESSKIMFLLKETYNHPGAYEIRGRSGERIKRGPFGTSKTFWRRMRMWTYIIDETLKGKEPLFEEVYKVKEEPNESIAYVNLKKYAEKLEYKRMAYSNYKDILYYVNKDRDNLLKQIDFIKPHIILCAGTFKFYEKLFQNIDKIADRLYKRDETYKTYIIDFSHLSQYGRGSSYIKNYYALMEIMKKVER